MLSFTYSYSFDELEQPRLFKYEICSYNGEPHEYIDESNNIMIYCKCKKEYANMTNLKKKINGIDIQCSYEKKRRLIVLFFAFFFPIGIEYLYLEIYPVFFVLFVLVTIMILGNCIIFAKAEIDRNKAQDDQYKNKKNYVAIIFYVLFFVGLFVYTINIILLGTGVIKDKNGIETLNDIKEIFEYIFTSD